MVDKMLQSIRKDSETARLSSQFNGIKESILLFVVMALSVAAQAALPATLKAIELPWGKKPLTIDGDFSDWGRMSWHEDFLDLDGQPQTSVKCRFALKRDRLNLYVAWRVDGQYRIAKKHVRRDGDIWHGNSVVEFFFARSKSANGFYQFSIAANGDRQDGADGDSFVTPDWEGVAKSDSNGWQAEVRIPFASLERKHYKFSDMIRMNVCMSVPTNVKGLKRAAIWSLARGSGFKNVDDMGYVAIGSFAKASAHEVAVFEAAYGEKPSVDSVAKGDERGYISFLGALAEERKRKDSERVEKLSARIAAITGLPKLLAQPWDPDALFGETPAAQADILGHALDLHGKGVSLDYISAVNETTHRSFALSAPKAAKDITFEISDLAGKGCRIPSSRLHVARFAFLHPPADISNHGREVRLPYPEIIERVRTPQSFKTGESSLFRLYLDTRGAKSGDYSGSVAIKAGGAVVTRLRVAAKVINLELPLAETRPFSVYLFTTIPWGGASAEEWAEFFRDHYMTDVSFEHPPVYLDGKCVNGKDAVAIGGSKLKTREEQWARYAEWMVSPIPVPPPGRVKVDLSAWKMDERLAACAKYNLRAVVSSRGGNLKSEYFPAMMEALAKVGIGADDFIYKLGDEDRSLVYLPVAKRLRELVPSLRVMMIPSGTSYWDIKPAAEGFTDFTFSTAAYRGGDEGMRDIAYLKSKGVKVSRYMNKASWAGRTLPLQARSEPWEALIIDGLDGYTCWTAGIRPNLGFRTGYKGYNKKYSIPELPPDRQIDTLLVYIRKDGEIYHPVSCIRLENIRDGIIDALYYRLAKSACEKHGNAAAAKVLETIRKSAKSSIADYNAARRRIAELILSL